MSATAPELVRVNSRSIWSIASRIRGSRSRETVIAHWRHS